MNNVIAVRMPEIGDLITVEWGLELCRHFRLDYLVERIQKQPGWYKSFRFDGCSCVPDELLGLFTGCDWKKITFLCCLPHDLGYAFGEPGNMVEKQHVDQLFEQNLVDLAEMRPWLAEDFMNIVKVGGAERFGLNFSWAFAHRLGNAV